jgi:hypothetical protein
VTIFREVNLEYRHSTMGGPAQRKTWFFAAPESRDSDADFLELLERIFADANAKLRAAEPDDRSSLVLSSFAMTPLNVRDIAGWTGATDAETTRKYLPWFLSERAVVWEFSACWLVDENGRYDGLDAYAFTELMLYRGVETQQIAEAEAVSFLDKLYSGRGRAIFDDRAARLRNIDVIRR